MPFNGDRFSFVRGAEEGSVFWAEVPEDIYVTGSHLVYNKELGKFCEVQKYFKFTLVKNKVRVIEIKYIDLTEAYFESDPSK